MFEFNHTNIVIWLANLDSVTQQFAIGIGILVMCFVNYFKAWQGDTDWK